MAPHDIRCGACSRKLGNILEWAGSVSEHAARVAAFRAAVEMGQSQAKAASIAKNLTTNFDRKGEMGQLVNTFYVFFNAAVQGSHRTLKMMANPKIRHYMAGMTASAVTLAFVAASWGGDDPDDGIAYWDKIPAHVKERNLIIPLPASVQLDDEQQIVGTNGNYIAIPLQYGLNLPVAFGYAVADAMRNMADPSSGLGGGPEWHHLIALGWLVINRLLGCFQSRKLHDIGFALEIAFRQSGECFHVARSQSDVSRDGVQRHDLLFDQKVDGATKQTWLLWSTILVSGF